MNVSRETSSWRNWPGREILIRGAAGLGVEVSPDRADLLLSFLEELNRWNRRINLVGKGDRPDRIVLHLLDSMAPVALEGEAPLRLLDIGSGGGLPGLVLKVLRPEWEVTLAESRDKRAVFLRHAVRHLNLRGVVVASVRLGRKSPPRDLGPVSPGDLSGPGRPGRHPAFGRRAPDAGRRGPGLQGAGRRGRIRGRQGPAGRVGPGSRPTAKLYPAVSRAINGSFCGL